MHEVTSFKVIKENNEVILAEITRDDAETKVGWLFDSRVKVSKTLKVIKDKRSSWGYWYEVDTGCAINGVESAYIAHKLMEKLK